MKQFFIPLLKTILLCPFLLLGGCQFIGTLYNVGDRTITILLDDRPFSQDIRDLKTNAALRKSLIEQDPKFGIDIEVTVFEDVVLLNGALPTTELIETVVQTVWRNESVKKVINYIRLDTPSTYQASEDASISAKIRTELSLTRGISASNYKLTMENGTIYLMGITKDDTELNKVISIIKNTPGVQDIIVLTRFQNNMSTDK